MADARLPEGFRWRPEGDTVRVDLPEMELTRTHCFEPVLSKAGLLTTVACGARGEAAYALEGSVFIAGAAIQWLRDGLGLLQRAAESEAMARSVEDAGGVVMVPAFVGLGAPYWRPDARGALLGITRGTTRAHVVRAALESLAFQSRDLVEAMARVVAAAT